MRYFIYLEYKGTAYHGWQIQPNAVSVQGVLDKALSTVLRTPIYTLGAGRTDTGVHAREMVAHFDYETPQEGGSLDTDKLAFKLNSILPADIAIHTIRHVRDDAHARFDATGRTYEYWVTETKSVFTKGLVTRLPYSLDYAAMNEAAKVLLEETDFASFCKAHSDAKTTLCDVRRAYWEKRGDCWVFTIEADRFLRNMVRATVGTLVEIGRGRMTKEDLRQVLHDKDRCAAGESMPSDGLYLTKIDYPDDIFVV